MPGAARLARFKGTSVRCLHSWASICRQENVGRVQLAWGFGLSPTPQPAPRHQSISSRAQRRRKPRLLALEALSLRRKHGLESLSFENHTGPTAEIV